jgi:hypothetical protein
MALSEPVRLTPLPEHVSPNTQAVDSDAHEGLGDVVLNAAATTAAVTGEEPWRDRGPGHSAGRERVPRIFNLFLALLRLFGYGGSSRD